MIFIVYLGGEKTLHLCQISLCFIRVNCIKSKVDEEDEAATFLQRVI